MATIDITQVGSKLCRIDVVPFLSEVIFFGDVIEAEPIAEDRLQFPRVAHPTCWKTYSVLWHPNAIEKQKPILDELLKLGGYWEAHCGGLLYVCIRPHLDYDPRTKFWCELVKRS